MLVPPMPIRPGKQKLYVRSLLAEGIVTLALAASSDAQLSQIQIQVTSNDTTFVEHVGGNIDAINTRRYLNESVFRYNSSKSGWPNTVWQGVAGVENNVSMSIENRSDRTIVNPQIVINGKGFLYSFNDLTKLLPLDSLNTLDDSIKAVVYYLGKNTIHWQASSRFQSIMIDPLKTLNVFGAGLCDQNADLLISILYALGYHNVRQAGIGNSHAIGFLHDGVRTIPMDGDIKVWYNGRDNRRLASFDELLNDQDLVRRQHHYGFSEQENARDTSIALFYSARFPHWENDNKLIDSLVLRLRPQEKITFTWGTHPDRYQFYLPGDVPAWPPPPTASLGYQEYAPCLNSGWLSQAIDTSNVVIDSCGASWKVLARDTSQPASFVLDAPNPYAITDGKVVLYFERQDQASSLSVGFSKDRLGPFADIYTSDSSQLGAIADTIDLYESIEPIGTPITNNYYIRFQWNSSVPGGLAIDSLKIINSFQLNPNVLPRLNVGDNTVRIMSSDGQPLSGIVYAHCYRTIDSLTVPERITQAVFPPNAARVTSTQFQFSWDPPNGMSPSEVSDYHIQVSDRADFKFPVSSTFDKLVSQSDAGVQPRWQIPTRGLLSPNVTYYWRVAIRSHDGVYSDWSPTWTFTVQVPGLVQGPHQTQEGDSICVRWQPSPAGEPPDRYLVLASNLKGFSYADSLIVDTVRTPYVCVKNAFKVLPYAFFRVVPLANDGSQGPMSDLVSMGNTRLLSSAPPVDFGDTIHVTLARIEPRDEFAVFGTPRLVITDSLKITNVPGAFSLHGDTLSGTISDPADTLIALGAVTSDSHQQLSFEIPLDVHNRPPLPIQLASFTAVVSGQGLVRLEWVTLSEMNNYGFEVQKSAHQLSNFQTVTNGFVPGHGTTLEPQHYSFTDSTAGSGVWWYRLKQIDLDGTTSYCDPARVEIMTEVKREEEIPTVFSLAQNYPNPWNPTTTIRYGLPHDSRVELEVYNVLGQRVALIVNAQQRRGCHQVVLNSDGLASGTYFYRLHADDFVQMRKLILLR